MFRSATGEEDLPPFAGESTGTCTADHPSRPVNDGVLVCKQHVFSPCFGVASHEAVDASAVPHRFPLALVFFSLMRDRKSTIKASRRSSIQRRSGQRPCRSARKRKTWPTASAPAHRRPEQRTAARPRPRPAPEATEKNT